MDYEKKHKEEIDRATRLWECGKITRESLEYIFPELEKSEDERIKKSLLDYLRTLPNHFSHNGGFLIDWLAWVEKQGEQKPFDYENANIQQKDFAPKENAPRYSIGDVLCDKSCTTLNKEAQSNFEITDIRNGMYICDKCSFPISQQDEYELVAKKIEQTPIDVITTGYWHVEDVEQKPVKWNEEDEAMINNLYQVIDEHIVISGDTRRMFCSWLESLKDRVQPKQEWSKEDKRCLTNAIYACEQMSNEDYEHSQGYIDAINWFKSLRPHSQWKPSDEQLNNILDVLSFDNCTLKRRELLESLYNDLKKLKE